MASRTAREFLAVAGMLGVVVLLQGCRGNGPAPSPGATCSHNVHKWASGGVAFKWACNAPSKHLPFFFKSGSKEWTSGATLTTVTSGTKVFSAALQLGDDVGYVTAKNNAYPVKKITGPDLITGTGTIEFQQAFISLGKQGMVNLTAGSLGTPDSMCISYLRTDAQGPTGAIVMNFAEDPSNPGLPGPWSAECPECAGPQSNSVFTALLISTSSRDVTCPQAAWKEDARKEAAQKEDAHKEVTV